MIDIPKTIQIGGRVYTVVFPHRFAELKNNIGFIDHAQMTIYLSDIDVAGHTVPDVTNLHAFLHEILHGIDYVFNNNELPEDMVARLAEGLLQVFLQLKVGVR